MMCDDDEDDDAADCCSFSCTALFGRMVAIGAIRAAARLLGLLMGCGIAFVFSADCDITGFTTIDFLFVSPPLSNGDDAAGTASFLRISSNVFVFVLVNVVVLGMFATTGTAHAVMLLLLEVDIGCTSLTNGPGANVVCAPFLLFRLSEL